MNYRLCVLIIELCYVIIRSAGVCFFFQAEDGIRDAQESRGLGDVYKRQPQGDLIGNELAGVHISTRREAQLSPGGHSRPEHVCLLYTSDAADDLPCVDLGGCRIIKKKMNHIGT